MLILDGRDVRHLGRQGRLLSDLANRRVRFRSPAGIHEGVVNRPGTCALGPSLYVPDDGSAPLELRLRIAEIETLRNPVVRASEPLDTKS